MIAATSQEPENERDELRVLIVEDSEIDGELVIRELKRYGYTVRSSRVDTVPALKAALETQSWDVVLSDYAMPRFTGLEALKMIKATGLDVPFILISGTIGEEIAVEAMRAGAHDYLLKDRLARLGPAVERELRDAEGRRARRAAEKELQRKSEEQALLLESIPTQLWYLTDAKTYGAVNKAHADFMGLPKEALEFEKVSELAVPDGVEVCVSGNSDPFDTKKSMYTEEWATNAQGERRLLAITRTPKLDENGDVEYVVCAANDITERKRAEEALRKSEAIYRDLIDNSADLIFTCDLKGKSTSVNPAANDLLGYSPEEFLALDLRRIIHPDFRADVERYFQEQVTKESVRTEPYEIMAVGKDSRLVWLEINMRVVLQSGKPSGVHGIARDITDRKRAEQVSRKHTQELEAINRLGREMGARLSSNDMVSSALSVLAGIVKTDCAILFLYEDEHLVLHGIESNAYQRSNMEFPVHRVGECLCGMAYEERKPVFSSNTIDDPRCTWEECKRLGLKSIAAIPLAAGGELMGVLALGSHEKRDFSSEENFIQSLAHEITMGLKNSLLFEEVQRHACLLEQRVSELRRSNEERDSLQSQLFQAQKMEAVGILSGGIAHDFNNLLQVIQGYSDLALFYIPEGQKAHTHLREIKKATRSAAELTQGLLTFSRQIESKLRPVDVNHEIRAVTAMLSRTIPKMVEIRTKLEEGIHTVNADPSQLQQVLINLALNARDAMPGGGTFTIETCNLRLDEAYCRTHLGTKPGDYVLLSVTDDGSGMDSKTKARIFDPFFTTKEMGKGTGLGLSIAYGIIRSHGGHILCYSEPGEGTAFKIYLPAIVEEGISSSKAINIEALKGGTETVLIIDDEEMVRQLAVETLSNFGYRVLSAPDGRQGIDLYRERPDSIDLVILDLIMPEMGGRQCLESILQINASAKVVIASGHSANGQLEDAHRMGSAAIISKPYDVTSLLTLVRQVLDAK